MRRPSWPQLRRWTLDGLLAFGVAATVAFVSPHNLATASSAVILVPGLLVRRRFPLVTALAALLSDLLLHGDLSASFTSAVAVYTVASRRGTATLTWIVVGVASVTVMLPLRVPHEFSVGDMLIFFVGTLCFFVVPALTVGLWVAQRRRLLESLRERAAQAERERDLLADRAVTAERHRIAREMHDVVAHRVSLIALQAGALSVTTGEERVAPVAELIRKTSATALAELREVLRALRDDEDVPQPAAGQSPLPTFADVRRLVDDAAAAGAQVELDMPDEDPDVPTAVHHAIYRVVQESLTNAAKHAVGAPVRVAITAGAEGIAVRVANDRGQEGTAVPGSGYGLLGMRERVSLAGGALHSGPAGDGGFEVRALLPLEAVLEEEPA
jgi:signal transduction histidine kinase